MDFHVELLLRICLGTLLGGLIGYERDVHGRPAGLRTHTLVALAATTFMVVSTHFVYWQNYLPADKVDVDPSRIAASVVSGIGFLAGGAILRTGLTVQGLTTAAGLWLVAAIGLAAGAGMYVVSILVTGIGIVALTLLRRFEDKDDCIVQARLSLGLHSARPRMSLLLDKLSAIGVTVAHESFEKDIGKDQRRLILDLRFPDRLSLEEVMGELETEDGVQHLRFERLA